MKGTLDASSRSPMILRMSSSSVMVASLPWTGVLKYQETSQRRPPSASMLFSLSGSVVMCRKKRLHDHVGNSLGQFCAPRPVANDAYWHTPGSRSDSPSERHRAFFGGLNKPSRFLIGPIPSAQGSRQVHFRKEDLSAYARLVSQHVNCET